GHQQVVERVIVELAEDWRPHQRQRDLLRHRAALVEEPFWALEGPRLAKPPAVCLEAGPLSGPPHQASLDWIAQRIDEIAQRLVVRRASRVASIIPAPECVVPPKLSIAASSDHAVEQL